MKLSSLKSLSIITLFAAFSVMAATPARADWYDGRHFHHGRHVPPGYVYDPRLGYYVYAPPVVVAQPGQVIVEQPGQPVVVTQPQAVYAQPQPVYVEPAPAELSVRVR